MGQREREGGGWGWLEKCERLQKKVRMQDTHLNTKTSVYTGRGGGLGQRERRGGGGVEKCERLQKKVRYRTPT